ncbi:MAG: glutaminyl-peptide cyclotransferase [Myxococcales bacterium]|nr:glutaminyl-peptide cyclotransferase [Myxococcales bacterium]MDH3483611.1 glutaminyl-peptide cyclotransferase [Myxococcales bacterium]
MARAKRRHTEAVKRAEQRSTRVMWAGMLVGGAVAVGVFLVPKFREPTEETVAPVEIPPADSQPAASKAEIEALRTRVLKRYPHDTKAFTQGLIWHDGFVYESTGQYGKSSLRRVRLDDGKVLSERKLDRELFGEGLARVDEMLITLTWRSGQAIVSEVDTLEKRGTLRYDGEGWGLCFDGTSLIMSDGSSTLTVRDPETLKVLRRVMVRQDGIPVRMLNELECVGSHVYANIWRRQEIVRIHSATGEVTASIDARGLLSREEAARADVLNGIAYKPDTETFLLTGKLWPAVFEVEFIPR